MEPKVVYQVVGGQVVSYNDKTKWGCVLTSHGVTEIFFSGWFRSERPLREPRVGEDVEVVYCEKKLVTVRTVR